MFVIFILLLLLLHNLHVGSLLYNVGARDIYTFHIAIAIVQLLCWGFELVVSLCVLAVRWLSV